MTMCTEPVAFPQPSLVSLPLHALYSFCNFVLMPSYPRYPSCRAACTLPRWCSSESYCPSPIPPPTTPDHPPSSFSPASAKHERPASGGRGVDVTEVRSSSPRRPRNLSLTSLVLDSLRQATSRAAFIHELPPEILLDIIVETVKETRWSSYYDRLYSLMLVCSGWASLIKSTPKLWYLVDKDRPDRIPLVLRRSNPMSLTIEHHKMGFRPDLDDALFQECQRWESIWIKQSSEDSEGDLPRRLKTSSLPIMKTLQVTGKAQWKPLWNLFGPHAPKLESLRLIRCSLPYDSPVFDNLRTLELAKVGNRSNSLNSFFEMLRRCKNVTTLDVMHLEFGDLAPEGNGDLEIHLPRLNIFRIRHVWQEAVLARLLATIRMPCAKEIIIRNFKAENTEDFPTSHLFQSLFNAADRINLAIEERTFRFTAYVARERTFELCGEGPLCPLQIAATQWGLAALKVRLEIRVQVAERVDLEPLFAAFRALPNITTIGLYALRQESMMNILRFLGDPYIATDGVKRWPCPNLENFLTRRCKGTLVVFLAMLKSRYGAGGDRPRRFKWVTSLISLPAATDEKWY